MKLTVEKVTGKNARAVKSIYLEAFPKEERMPFWTMRLLDKLPATQLLAFLRRGGPCAGSPIWVWRATWSFSCFSRWTRRCAPGDTAAPFFRSSGNGIPATGHVVSIELCSQNAPNRDQRLRRKAFYLNNGYEETGWQITLSKVPQEVLAANGEFDPRSCGAFSRNTATKR